ncbi:hypothetical protein NE619_02205 [Anaerovorax odorimutans]|uniref:Uncharacterized protein n=1 Tax=Anaerovorax odorimutans TaxID=109327 RepID=A0ABT1RK32_9FIRM|nr:hypothetical protein [Anaerovorax odorimutans]MCQ4635529.1 hypothetical protein [Anaerovorax odorimutans]
MELLNAMVEVPYISIPAMFVFLALQLYLCIKKDRVILKFIPAVIIGLLLIFTTYAVATEVFSGFTGMGILLLVYACIAAPGLIGVAAAWIVYGIYTILTGLYRRCRKVQNK